MVALLALLMSPGLIFAQDSEGSEESKNAIELFLGLTFVEHEDTEASIGLGYVRRVAERGSISGLVEYTKGREWVFALPVIFDATEQWKLYLGPGLEHEDGENEFLVRFGTAYEWEMDGWTLSPELNFDFVDGDVKYVVGLTFGWPY